MEYKTLSLSIKDEIAMIVFDVKDAKVNTWCDIFTKDFINMIFDIKPMIRKGDIKAIIFISGKEEHFHAGGDLKDMSPENANGRGWLDAFKGIEVNQWVMKQIHELTVPVIAAIDGQCLGGGMEFALACDVRIAKEGRRTIFGLPEVSVGLLPGGSGTTRLTELIGWQAIDIITNAKILSAKKALDVGVIDVLVAVDDNLAQEAVILAKQLMNGERFFPRDEKDLSNAAEISRIYRDKYLEEHEGKMSLEVEYVFRILEEGLAYGIEASLEMEKKYFSDILTVKILG